MEFFRRAFALGESFQSTISTIVGGLSPLRVGAIDSGDSIDAIGNGHNPAKQHEPSSTDPLPNANRPVPDPIPGRLSTTRPLRPGIRHRAVIERARLLRMDDEAHGRTPSPAIPHTDFGGEMVSILLWEDAGQTTVITQEHLDAWQARFEDLLPVAIDNMADQPTAGWSSVDGHVWQSRAGDPGGGSHLLLPDFVEETGLRGELVIVHPRHDLLLASPAEDTIGVRMVCEQALAIEPDETTLSFKAVVGRDETWQSLELPDSHPAANTCRHLSYLDTEAHYAELRPLIQSIEDDARLGNYTITKFEAGQWMTSTTWNHSTPHLLPRTIEIELVDHDGSTMIVGWDELKASLGPAMQQTTYYPELWRVEEFPSRNELRRMSAR